MNFGRKTMKPGLRKVAALILASAMLFGSGAVASSASDGEGGIPRGPKKIGAGRIGRGGR